MQTRSVSQALSGGGLPRVQNLELQLPLYTYLQTPPFSDVEAVPTNVQNILQFDGGNTSLVQEREGLYGETKLQVLA